MLMAHDLETALLRSFVTAVRAGSISRAAAALGRTQPALSQQLRKLERAVGSPLLHRAPSGVSPTRAGEELLPYAERILALSAQALAETGRALTGHCGVGLLEDLAASRLSQALADLARCTPARRWRCSVFPARRCGRPTTRVVSNSCSTRSRIFPGRRAGRCVCRWSGPSGRVSPPTPIRCRWCCSPTRAPGERRCWKRWRAQGAAGGWRSKATVSPECSRALRAGLGVAALLPANLEPAMACHDEAALPALPDVELGLTRHPGTEGDALIDAVETALRRMI